MIASNRKLLRGVSALALAGALALAPRAANAEQWSGIVSGDWYDPANWIGGVPAGGFDVLVNRTAPHPLVLDRGEVDLGGKAIAIGTTANGAMTITGGADLVSGQSTITAEPQSTGIVTVTGAGSTWTTDHLVVGFQGTATLNIENGGVVSSGSVTAARNGGNAIMTVDGAGSRWEIGDVDAFIGHVGSAEMTISNGGVVTNAKRVHLGNSAGSSGSVTVDGDGSRWEVGEHLVIGLNGSGALSVTDGGYVEADIVTVGSHTAGETASLILDGKGSELHADGGIQIGFADEPVVRITGGAKLTTGRLEDNPFIGRSYVGYLQPRGKTASVLISGEGSVWETANYIVMGNSYSDTTIRVEDGGALRGYALDVGRGRGIDPDNPDDPLFMEAKFFASGAGTTVDFDWLAVGNAGAKATVEFTDAAAVTTGRTYVAGGATSNNQIVALSDVDFLLSGAGTRWSTTTTGQGSFSVDDGEARLRVTDRAHLDIAGDAELGGYYRTSASQSKLRMSIDGAAAMRTGGNGLVGNVTGAIAAVTVDGAGSAWTVDQTLVVGAGGSGTLRATNGGKVAAAGIEIARDAGSSGTLFIGGETAAAAAGIVDTPTIAFGAGTGALVFNHTGTVTFATALSGVGEVRQRAGVTRLTGDSSAFGGTTFIDGGALAVLNTLGGRVELGAGGILYGTGTIGGDLTVTGGVLSPGANAAGDIGTLSVGGNFSIAGGAFYTANILGSGGSDLVAVTGSAALNGGSVYVSALDPEASYAAGQTYTILTAGAGVTGEFAGLQTGSAFIDPKLVYEANAVRLTINESDLRFTDVAETWNQWQAASGLEALARDGDALAVYNQLLMQAAPEARAAFDLASGEAHASAQHLSRNTASLFLGALQGRASRGLDAQVPLATAPMAYSAEPRPRTLPSGLLAADAPVEATDAYVATAARGGWIAPLGGGGTIDGDGNAAGVDWRALGIAGGYEGYGEAAGGRYIAGLSFGYLNSEADIDDRLSGIDGDGVHVGVYGGWTNDAWSLSGALAYSATKLSTERAIVFGGIDRQARADYWSHAVAASAEVAREFDVGGVTLSPFAGFEAGWTGHGAAGESGAGALDLAVASADYAWFDTSLGLGAAYAFATAGGDTMRLSARAAWVHALGDVMPEQELAFAGSPQAFAVRGPGTERDRARIGLGIDYSSAGGFDIGAAYTGEFSGDAQSHTGRITFGMKF